MPLRNMCKKHIWAAEEFLWWWADNFLIASSCSQKKHFVSTQDTNPDISSFWEQCLGHCVSHSFTWMKSKWQHLWLSSRGLLFCSVLTSKGTAKVISRKDKFFFSLASSRAGIWRIFKSYFYSLVCCDFRPCKNSVPTGAMPLQGYVVSLEYFCKRTEWFDKFSVVVLAQILQKGLVRKEKSKRRS